MCNAFFIFFYFNKNLLSLLNLDTIDYKFSVIPCITTRWVQV